MKMNEDENDPIIPMTENELRASLLLMAAASAIIVVSMNKACTPEGQRMKIENEAEKIIQIARDRNRERSNNG